jgi:hypothetical protein
MRFFYANLMNHAFPNMNELTITFWMGNSMQTSNLKLAIYHSTYSFNFLYDIVNNPYYSIKFNINSQFQSLTTFSSFYDWNLHTFKISIDPVTSNIVNINIYFNLVHFHSTSLNTGVEYINISTIHFGCTDSSNSSLILYGMWIQK